LTSGWTSTGFYTGAGTGLDAPKRRFISVLFNNNGAIICAFVSAKTASIRYYLFDLLFSAHRAFSPSLPVGFQCIRINITPLNNL